MTGGRPTRQEASDPARSNGPYEMWSHKDSGEEAEPGTGKYTPQNVDPFLCTHLIYAFSIINNKNELITYEWNDETLYKSFNGLKSK
ncbi:Acidic mammalian chitinase [Liparis tanakae]|uniref:Acidic mammalian chitinase n=1 Tax=Liparis tanakae TaxID=230148 RepID=A0A4Z2JDI7_9TELE|nr:Acidic mammalian chitinase [Liparis tanakae]